MKRKVAGLLLALALLVSHAHGSVDRTYTYAIVYSDFIRSHFTECKRLFEPPGGGMLAGKRYVMSA